MPNKELKNLIARAIIDRLHEWESDNDYVLISEEIQRLFPVEKNNVFVRLKAPRTSASIEDILEEFPCYSFDISKENLKTLLSRCKDPKSKNDNFDIEYLANTLSSYDSIKEIVKLNEQQLFEFINKKLNSIEFNLLKKAFNNAQIETSPANHEDSYLYLAQIMLAIGEVMKPIQERFETAFTNYSYPERVIYGDIEIKPEYKRILKEANNFHKTYLANNRLDELVYPSKKPHRTATTGDQLDSYIKGLYSKGVYITEDLQRKAAISTFPKKFDELQKTIFKLNKEINERIIRIKQDQDVRQQALDDVDTDDDEYDYNIVIGCVLDSEISAIIALGNEIDGYYDTKNYISACINDLINDHISRIKEKLELLFLKEDYYDHILVQIKNFQKPLNKIEEDLAINLELEDNKYLLNQFELLAQTIPQTRKEIAVFFTNIKNLSCITNEQTKEDLSDFINQICNALSKEVDHQKNKITEGKLEEYRMRFEGILELNDKRESLLQPLYEDANLTQIPAAISHQKMQKILELKLPKVENNILTYMALFCVDPELNNPESKRIFIPVDIDIDEENSLHAPRRYDDQGKSKPSTSSSASDDNQIYANDQNQVIQAFKHDDTVFIDSIGRRNKHYTVDDILNLTPPPFSKNQKSLFSEISNHSERVFTTALRKPETIDALVKNLEKKLRALNLEKANSSSSKTKHKVYSLTILAYSRNTVCQHCTRALIAQLNDTEPNTSFLAQLDARINQSPLFRTSAKPAEKANDIRLKRSTVIIAGKEYKRDPQALLHRDFPQTSFVANLAIPRPGVLDLKQARNSSFVEVIRSEIEAFPRREIIGGGACISSDQITGKISKAEQNNTAKEGSGPFPFTRRVELRRIPSHYK